MVVLKTYLLPFQENAMKMFFLFVSLSTLLSACGTAGNIKQAKVVSSQLEMNKVCAPQSFKDLWAATRSGKTSYISNCCVGLCGRLGADKMDQFKDLIVEKLHVEKVVLGALLGDYEHLTNGKKNCILMTPRKIKQ